MIELTNDYRDVPGFCKSATLEELQGHGFVLTPGRYVGAADIEDDQVPFVRTFAALSDALARQFALSRELETVIDTRLRSLTNGS